MQSLNPNKNFVSGPDMDEFNSKTKTIKSRRYNFYIFSSKSFTTDETSVMFKMAISCQEI